MHAKSQMALSRRLIPVLIVLFGLISFTLPSGGMPAAHAQGGYDPSVQTQTLLYDEARTVYLGNLARRDNGIPPLRWNRQLTHAARWFSWDSTENRPAGFCGHQDSQGHDFSYRTLAFGYLGFAGAENAYCGYVTPETAIQGWMNSSGHRTNLLSPSSREIGLGYYRRDSDGRGYVTQDFGSDAVYAPIIIENEALSTTSPNVNLYIYDRSTGGGFAGLDTATQMMVSNNAQFSGAAWESYNANKAWTLASGTGWREVYVKTRDKFNRSLTVSDTIYLGANLPLNELGAAQMSTTQSQVTLYNLNGGTLPQAQFSLGWLADDTSGTFNKWWGNGERVNDAAAWGGTAYRLYPGNSESFAWVYDTNFMKDVPLVAYFRLKVNNNTSSSEVARISVDGGGTEYGPRSLRGTDFAAPNQYQEFAVNFTFHSNPDDPFLTFQFWRSGSADVYVDAVSIFSAPQAITSPLTWSVPGNNYRGQGVWVRYTNGSQFSPFSEAITNQPFTLTVNKVGTGTGTVTSNPAGINCGSTCSYQFNSNTDVTLTASALSGSAFTGWSGGGCSGPGVCTVRMTAATTVTANFELYTPINVTIGGDLKGSHGVVSNPSLMVSYPNTLDGPVKVVSPGGVPIVTSQRVVFGNSFNELMGYPVDQFTTEYWFPWYDMVYMNTWVLVGNPSSTQTAYADIYIGGVKKNNTPGGVPYAIPPGDRVLPQFPGVLDGPVRVVSVTGSGTSTPLPIFASERSTYLSSFNEVMGYPVDQFTTEYWFPWYDQVYMNSWVLVGNPSSTQTAYVDIYIAGVKRNTTPGGIPYAIPPNGRVLPQFPSVLDGPVRVVSVTGTGTSTPLPIFASERSTYQGSFNEVMGYPANQFTTEYWYPWFQHNTGGMSSWLLVGNPSTAQTAYVDIYIGGFKRGNYSIAPSDSIIPQFSLSQGPVRVVSVTGAGTPTAIPIFTSERSLYGPSFNEVMGYPANQLSSEYWFTWYDSVYMTTELYVSKP